jgi:hypothetical protein
VASRARLSAALPELRLRAARSRDESLRLAPTAEDPYRFTLAGGNGLLLEGQATFRLNRLLFADEELAVERLRIERERGSERRQARVTARVLAWHRAVSRERSAASAEERGRAELLRVEAEVELDVLTGGWFGPRVAAARPWNGVTRGRSRPWHPRPPLKPSDRTVPALTPTWTLKPPLLHPPRHARRSTQRTRRPSKARRCAKGVSLTSLACIA